MKRFFLLVALALLTYVATVAVTQAAGPGPVDQAKLQQIKIRFTSEAEVRSLLGEPTSVQEKEVPGMGKNIVPIKILGYGPVEAMTLIYINEKWDRVFAIKAPTTSP